MDEEEKRRVVADEGLLGIIHFMLWADECSGWMFLCWLQRNAVKISCNGQFTLTGRLRKKLHEEGKGRIVRARTRDYQEEVEGRERVV